MTSPAPAVPPAKQARSIESRKRLLEATVQCLIEHGYARTTTTEIVKYADLSQGALFKHFPNKALLMGATAEHLFATLGASYRAAFTTIAEERIKEPMSRLDAAIELLWAVFMASRMKAANELYTAARSDPALAEALRPIMERHTRNLEAEGARLFPEITDRATLSSVIAGIMTAMQGASLTAEIRGATGTDSTELAFVRRAVLRDCAGAFAEPIS